MFPRVAIFGLPKRELDFFRTHLVPVPNTDASPLLLGQLRPRSGR